MVIPIKDEAAVAKIRAAGQILIKTFDVIKENLQAGITTLRLNSIIEKTIEDCGAKCTFKNYNGFPAGACISIDEEVIHGIPSFNRRFQEGQIVSIDIGATLDGFVADAARTYIVGKTTPEKQKLVEVTEQSFFEGIKNIRAGKTIGDIGYQVQTYAESFGYGVVRDFCGHGVGAALHEDPEVPNFGRAGKGVVLKSGMCLAIEPMINLGTAKINILSDGWTIVTRDGKPSAHYENTVLITETGVEILTLR